MRRFIASIVTFVLTVVIAYFLPGDPIYNAVAALFATIFFGFLKFLLRQAIQSSLELTILFLFVGVCLAFMTQVGELISVLTTLLIWMLTIYVDRNSQKITKGVLLKRSK